MRERTECVENTTPSDALSSMQIGTRKNGLKLPTVRVITQTTDVVLKYLRLLQPETVTMVLFLC